MSQMYEMFGGAVGQPAASHFSWPMNPMQRMQLVLQAMRNPSAFLKQKFPDIPDQIMNDPNQILNYLQQTRGITEQDIQNTKAQMMQGGTPWQGQ